MPPPRIDDIIARAHQRQGDICARLEALADRLPRIDRAALPALAEELMAVSALSAAARQALSRMAGEAPDTSLSRVLDRLLGEIDEDGQSGEEVADILRQYGAGFRPICPTALGYLLRGYFSATRRRIAREADLLQHLDRTVPA